MNDALRIAIALGSDIDVEVILLCLVVLNGLIIVRAIHHRAEEKRRRAGIGKSAIAVSVEGSTSLPGREYVSELQGLAGRPDAVISEEGFFIPVECKPLARKIRDRYVAQLLVYMRLVEEFEGRKPPYGYLILGPSCRRFKIENSPERQEWLQRMLDEMKEIAAGKPAQPAPHPRKCSRCDVKDSCAAGGEAR